MTILALESSCDDTCAAVLGADGRLRANVISSQGVHDRFGGVVPEIASRQHLELINLVVEQALGEAGVTLEQIDLIAATQGPGLVGALLVWFSTGKGPGRGPRAAVRAGRSSAGARRGELPGPHAGRRIRRLRARRRLRTAVPLPDRQRRTHAAGGVTEHEGYEVLGRTLDDAAGEAFDKGARMLGLGYPGGAALEAARRRGRPRGFLASRARAPSAPAAGAGRGGKRLRRGLDFSFAGLKTALLYKLRELGEAEAQRAAPTSRPPIRRRSSTA